MVMNGYSAFPKAPSLPEPYHQIVFVIPGHSLEWGLYLSAEKQSMYSTAPADWVKQHQINRWIDVKRIRWINRKINPLIDNL